MAVFVRNPSMSWCRDTGRNHWTEKCVPKNDTLLKFACTTLITTACMWACVISSLPMSSYVADGVLWRLVVLDLLLCIWVSLTNWLLNGGEGFFSTVVRERRLKRSFKIMYWTRGRSYHSLSKDLAEIWMIWLIQRQLGFDIAQFILELCDKYI